MAIKVVVATIAALAIIGALAGVKIMQFQAMGAAGASAGPPPEAVATVEVKPQDWQPTLDAVGNITPVQGVTLSVEYPGTVKRIAFDSGVTVKAGQVLVELDSTTERAQLQAAEASAELARTNLESGTQLVQSGAIAGTQYITLVAQSKQADAEVERLRAIIAKKTIRAPFSGRTGLRQINLGQFLGNGDKVVSLLAPDPVYVDFALPQQRLVELTEGLKVQVTSDTFAGSVFEGSLTAIEPELDEVTRNIRLRGTLKNPDGKLRPGMFVHAFVVLPRTERVLAVPTTAINYAPYGDSIFVVVPGKDGKSKQVEQRFVRIGTTRGDYVAVTQGVKPGEQVVVTGAFKLRNGASILINNALLPKFSTDPKPKDT